MGYGSYVLPDGRQAGYLVESTCDLPAGCETTVFRGLDALCGASPDGHRAPEEPGCGKYFCGAHGGNHDCVNPRCGAYSADGNLCCRERADHLDRGRPHRDIDSDESFDQTEDDVVDENGMVPA